MVSTVHHVCVALQLASMDIWCTAFAVVTLKASQAQRHRHALKISAYPKPSQNHLFPSHPLLCLAILCAIWPNCAGKPSVLCGNSFKLVHDVLCCIAVASATAPDSPTAFCCSHRRCSVLLCLRAVAKALAPSSPALTRSTNLQHGADVMETCKKHWLWPDDVNGVHPYCSSCGCSSCFATAP